MRFSEKLYRACTLRRMTNQRELADLARVSKSALNRWINGESVPSVEEAWRLAKVLEVPLEWLAADDDQETPPASPVSEEEGKILWMVRTIGTDEAARRLALVGSEKPATVAPNHPLPAPKGKRPVGGHDFTHLDDAEVARENRAAREKSRAGSEAGKKATEKR